MYNFHIEAMTEKIIDALDKLNIEISHTYVIKEALEDYWKDKIASTWNIDDIKHIDSSLDDDECIEILYNIHENFDAELGINWETIICAVDDYLENRKEKMNNENI